MPALRASVLIVSHPNPATIAFGADFAATYKEAQAALGEFRYPVIVLPTSLALDTQALEFLDFAGIASPLSQRVVIQNDSGAEGLRMIINTGSVFRILSTFGDPRFDLTIEEALEEYRLLQQNMKLLQLVNEQNDRLKKLTADLEERVEARRKSLEEAKEKLLITNHRVEALHRALVAIHRAGSIAEMERLINEALSGALGLSWTRILFQSQARVDGLGPFNPKVVALHSAALLRGDDRHKETLGHIHFARSVETPFTRDETSFLGQIADAVSLAIDRLTKLEQSETLKHQWEATFDAIVDPVSLITADYTLVRINRSFAERSNAEPEKVIGRKCFEALFGRTSPCEGCEVVTGRPLAQLLLATGTNFRLKPARTVGGPSGNNAIYDVFSQEIQFKHEARALYVNMYHDVSNQLRLERQIVESAKMAELGTIGSSIAHELNNPLGGMLSFLQLIKMDLKGEEAWFGDIDEMETGARRCRDIVQSLLGFTRKSAPDVVETIDLREVVEQALKITELQTRSMGISVHQEIPRDAVELRGEFNAIAQSLRNFLQNAQEAIAERQRSGDATSGNKLQGEIKVRLSVEPGWCVVEIADNGAGFDPQIGEQIYDPMYTTKDPVANPGLGLTVAQQIIRDHGGRLEISSTRGSGTSAKISFPRLAAE
jgi:two-component system NtrC family sensor kinase